MGDMYCAKCGEPWDSYGVIASLKSSDGDMTKEEAERFMKGEGCPCCGFGKHCPSCRGSGKCNFCEGTGVEKIRDWISDGWIERTCTWCNGSGTCQRCGGDGKLKENHEDEYYDGLIEADGEIDVLDFVL